MNNLCEKPDVININYIFNDFDKFCKDYGMHGEIIVYDNKYSTIGNGTYAVVSSLPIPENFKPLEIVNNAIRNPNLFFPHFFAMELTPESGMVVLDRTMDFCKDAEFLHALYAEYNATVPLCIRRSELAGLKNWCEGRANERASYVFRDKCRKGLQTFFSNENSKSKRVINQRKFFRTERFDLNANYFTRKRDYINRNSPIIRLDLLLQSSDEIKILKIEKGTYKRFCDYLKNCFPDITIAVSTPEIIDYGLIDLSKKLGDDHPAFVQKPITNEEFEKIIEKNFANEGFNCIRYVTPTKWEFRDVYYKNVDEPQIIQAYFGVFLNYAKSDDFFQIEERGPFSMIDIPIDDFMYFVALAKTRKLKFHIDLIGRFAKPSLSNIHVIYNNCNQNKMDEIANKMIDYNVLDSHIISYDHKGYFYKS